MYLIFSISNLETYVSGLATYVSKPATYVSKPATTFFQCKDTKKFVMKESFIRNLHFTRYFVSLHSNKEQLKS
jgi:hypothetical protein